MSESTPMLEPVRQVFDNPILLGNIASYLDHGNSRDLVAALSVSKAFFDASASVLCRRVEVPVYEFSTRKKRETRSIDMPYFSSNQNQPESIALLAYTSRYPSEDNRIVQYRRPTDPTAHCALQPGVKRGFIKRHQADYRLGFRATAMMKELYKHVRVITVETHEACDRLAVAHPLPFVRTVIVRGGHRNVCKSPGLTSTCGFLPREPFRLVLDGVCDGMVCGSCTSPYLLSQHVETLVIRLSYDSPRFHCATRKFPNHFNPKRLVLLFPQEPSMQARRRQAVIPSSGYIVAYGPGEGGDSPTNEFARLANTFYQLAAMALAVNDNCEIYVVAADNAALHVEGLERYDHTLPKMDPSHPGNQVKEVDKVKDHTPPNLCASACYDQNGEMVWANTPYPVTRALHLEARSIIDKRVSVMESLVHRWIDHILDSRLPSEAGNGSFEEKNASVEKEQDCHDNRQTNSGDKDVRTNEGHYQRFLETHTEAEPLGGKHTRGSACAAALGAKEDIEKTRRIKHETIRFISTFEFHEMEGNNDEMDDPARYR